LKFAPVQDEEFDDDDREEQGMTHCGGRGGRAERARREKDREKRPRGQCRIWCPYVNFNGER